MDDIDLTIAQVIEKYGLLRDKSRSKSFGQHFLCDSSLLRKIAICAAPFDESCDIVEIGPGPGGLTRAILEVSNHNNKLFCIEKDESLSPVHDNLNQRFHKERLEFIYADALDIKLQGLTDKGIVIISNLPYNVGTKILLNWLLDLRNIKKMVLMFQKEVADRICAKVGTKEYGRLSVIAQLLCNTEKLFNVSNLAFYPPPKVVSSVVKLTPKSLDIPSLRAFEHLTNVCFQHRRKTIYSILRGAYKGTDIEKILGECEIEKLARPETVSPEKFWQLSVAIDCVRSAAIS